MVKSTGKPLGPKSPPPVVAIGASAGGVEALQHFFAAIPDDLGLAYVVIVHLAPDRDSELPDILARHTRMPVRQVGDHDTAKLRPNHVYVIAPNRKLEVTDTSVGASRFEQPRGQRTAIDLFFRSLAERHGDGFAVVLSGSGSDGAMGAKAIKESGGLVLVQDPREAAHDGMPRAVISTGVADVILPARELGERLAALARSKVKVAESVRTVATDVTADEGEERSLRGVFDLLRKGTGHDFAKYKRGTVLRRLGRRMQLSHRVTVTDYLDYLKENVEEVQALFDDLLISVTTFFRDAPAWQALREQVIAPLIDHAEHDVPIRAWVPGCATGEEAYSLAILFQEEIDRRQPACTVTIFASDVDESALAIAREGIYPDAISADVSEARLERYFRHDDHRYMVTGSIRERVVFASHSLLRDPPFSRLDLVSCRNLLIYLDRELQGQVMDLFQYACKPRGYLFLGASESADDDSFRAIDKQHRIFQVQKPDDNGRQVLPALMGMPRGISKPAPEPMARPRHEAAEVHLEALEAVAPPSLLVDQDWNVVHLSNSAARYLGQRGGPVARQVTDVVRADLRDEVHTVLRRTFEGSAEQQASEFVAVRFNGTARRVAVVAQRHERPDRGSTYVLLTFVEAGDATAEEVSADTESSNAAIGGLREKLRQAELHANRMRDDYHLANEDLRAANEELQSLNEEYRSTTEELETSKEELQSVNEELQTVNYELKQKVDALSRTNSDLENLMAATSIPILFLDRDLCIKRMTPELSDIFSVTSRDQGRPIGNFTHRLRYSTLIEDVRSVLDEGKKLDREVEADNNQAFIVRMHPYRTATEAAEGVVLSFVDVTDLKYAGIELRESEEQFRALVDASAQVVWRMDEKGRVASDSPSWRAFTGQTCEQWQNDWLEAIHPGDRAGANKAWQQAIETKSELSMEFRVYHAPSGIHRWMTVRAVPLKKSDDTVRGWVGMHVDIHERRIAEEALRDADARKDEFLAMLGHELRNPLAAIRSSVAVHQAVDAEASTSNRAWAIVDRQSTHMTKLINDLLDVVRLDRGKLRLDRKSISLHDCIAEVVEAVQPRIDASHLTIDVDLHDEPLYVYADPERLVQILDNLLRNAVSYTDSGGKIQIRARQDGRNAIMTVSDTGIGMEAEQVESLFKPYRQSHNGGRGGGLGLGLTLVRNLVRLHGGKVTARSDGPGTGSEFEVIIPVAKEGPTDAAEPALSAMARQVLVVDDETDVADMFAAMLENLGQKVVVAYSGEQAIAAACRQKPEIAFLDLRMPGMGGSELARQLREHLGTDKLCLVALSGYSVDTRSDMAEFDRHLLKPATRESVVALLNGLAG